MKHVWYAGGDLSTPTSPVAPPIIVCLWTWCNNCNTVTMAMAILVCSLFLLVWIIFVTLVCECRGRLWDMITIQQQTCYCDMLMLKSYIFCNISKPILKWHIIMLTLQNYAIFTIMCQYNILCHFNISLFTV